MKRRRFLTGSAAAALGFQVVPSRVVRAAPGRIAPNDKLRIAAIGCGGRGEAVLGGLQSEDIVALCDVDDRRAAGSFGRFLKAERFKDFRVMFDKIGGRIDAVLVATPDHTHSTAAMAAIARGKHVYCEKPLAHSIGEVRALRRAAREHQVITQVGNQGHSSDSIRVFRELVEAGAIGRLTEVDAGYRGSYCRIGRHPDLREGREAVPAELDWDLWQGPAARRPFHPAYLPGNWRGFADFGTGSIGDWVCHVLDPVFWAGDLGLPAAVTAETTGWDPADDRGFFPRGARVTYEFPARNGRGPVRVRWHEGSFEVPLPPEADPGSGPVGTGAVVRGDQGVIVHGSHGAGGVHIVPKERHREFVAGGVARKFERIRGGHQGDWLDAVRAGRPAGSGFDYGGALTEIALLGIIAMHHPGRRLEWNAESMQFTDCESANAMVAPPLHNGWTIDPTAA